MAEPVGASGPRDIVIRKPVVITGGAANLVRDKEAHTWKVRADIQLNGGREGAERAIRQYCKEHGYRISGDPIESEDGNLEFEVTSAQLKKSDGVFDKVEEMFEKLGLPGEER